MIFKNENTLAEISEILECKLIGDPLKIISGINRIEDAKENDITFLANDKYSKYLSTSNCGCIIVDSNFNYSEFSNKFNFILSDDPRLSFYTLLIKIDELNKKNKRNFIHPSVQIGQNCEIHQSVYIGANCVIGDNCKIAEDTIIYPGCVILDNVEIGNNNILYPNITLYDESIIGNNCIIHSGVVIGSDGFGFLENPDGSYIKIPQLGNVIIKDDVEIGSNTTIDRALLGSTIIEKGVKIDNLVQIAHNVIVGENSAIVAQTGISGSSKIGKRNRIAGQCGIAGHITSCDDVTLMAKSGVSKSIQKPGEYFGIPIKERYKAFKIEAVINNLPELRHDISIIKRKIGI